MTIRSMFAGVLGLAIGAAIAVSPAPASGQVASAPAAVDGRWLAWVGCWEGAGEVGVTASDRVLVCFTPLASGSGVEIATYAPDGELVASESLFADDVPVPAEEGGCAGTRTAGWSADGMRVHLSSDLSCGEALSRRTRGVLAFLPAGEGWIEIQSAQAGGASPMLGIRSFVRASNAVLAGAGIPDPAVGRELAVGTARTRAAGRLSADALVDLANRAGPEVTSALIVERGERYGLDASLLRSLDDRGVPAEVLDVMVAVSHPERFQVGGSADAMEPSVREAPTSARVAERPVAPWPDYGRRSYRGYSPWRFGYFDPFWSDPYLYDPFLAGYYGYGYGYGYDAYGYRPFGAPYYQIPRVIVVTPPTVEETSRSFLDRNRGVVPRDGGSSAGSASSSSGPRDSRSSPPASSRDSGSAGARDSGSSGDGSSGSDSGNVRRAVPRTGDGGDR